MGLFGDKTPPSCSFPDHHTGSDSGGMPAALVVVLLAMVAFSLLGWVLHWIMIALLVSSLTLIGGATAMILLALHRRLLVSQPPAAAGRDARQMPAQTQQGELGPGQHLHLHLDGMQPGQAEAILRRITRGQ